MKMSLWIKSIGYLKNHYTWFDSLIEPWFDLLVQSLGFEHYISNLIIIITKFLIIILLLLISSFALKKMMNFIAERVIKSRSFIWDDVLSKNNVFDSLIYFSLLLIGLWLSEFFFSIYGKVIIDIKNFFNVLFSLVVLTLLLQIIDSITQITTDENNYRNLAVRSFFQLLKVFVVVLCILIIISILFHVQLTTILTSLGALTALLVLIFKDTILGFVSGMQMASTKMIKIGDWISISKHAIEGTVIEINLVCAKIENFDKTISTVPTYDLITTAVTNFEEMRQKNIRRIKRTILLNIKSFQFCDTLTLERFKKFLLIHDYIEKKQREIEVFNKKTNLDTDVNINSKRLTNIGIFRQYAISYLQDHSNVSQKESLMVRHLETTPHGLPLEIYCFAATSEWLNYERIQADIFDHLLTATKEFDLEVIQASSGNIQK